MTPAVRQSCGVPPSVTILAPVPVPYREPLFRALAERGRVAPHVVYLSGGQAGWDQPPEWFSSAEGYPSQMLEAWHQVYEGCVEEEIAQIEAIALDRSRFMRQEP